MHILYYALKLRITQVMQSRINWSSKSCVQNCPILSEIDSIAIE